ncbi:hypothetical protein GALL_513800 [mine drainage metagenome]|uniref:Uncharacterized protein n=1 Tax=mine drainage metagenome TaxID=410659 RepID=A0A1J5PGY2_9ZZZZ
MGEHGVGLGRMHHPYAGHLMDGSIKTLRHGVGMAGVTQPVVVFQHAQPGRGNEAHLRGELPGLLHAPGEIGRQLAVEKHHRFAHGQTVLGAAEAQHVHPGAPGDVARMTAQRSHGVGEPGPVHVQLEMVALGHGGNGAHLFDAIHRAQLGGLGDGDDLGLGRMNVAALGGQKVDGLGRELAAPRLRAFSLGDQQLGAAGEKLRTAALIGFDMRHRGADHCVIALAHGGQRQRVGRGAVEHEVHVAIGLERFAQPVGDAVRPAIVAIRRLMARCIGLQQPVQGFGTDAGVVIAGKMLAEFRGVHGASF